MYFRGLTINYHIHQDTKLARFIAVCKRSFRHGAPHFYEYRDVILKGVFFSTLLDFHIHVRIRPWPN